MSRYFHVDLDAFFAAVEQLDHPELKGKPVVVGAAPGQRGVVSTCSYEARAFGVRSAMPISEAARLCPKAAFLPVRMERYAQMSQAVMAILDGFTPDVIRVSIDEASLDMGGTDRLWGSTRQAARAIKDAVGDKTGLGISIGAAPNRYVAKIASGYQKPDGLTIVEAGDEDAFMAGLSLDKLWGAGGKTRERLAELGVRDMATLRSLSQAVLRSVFGASGGAFLYGACRGVDPGVYATEAKSHSMSTETTFGRDVRERETLESVLLIMSEELAYRMYAESVVSRTVVLKLRYDDFETVSARETRQARLSSSAGIYETALGLLARKWTGRPIRLIGLGLASLSEGDGGQGQLFEERSDREARLERAAFEAKKRGLGTITRARLIKPAKKDKPASPGEPEGKQPQSGKPR